MNSNALVASRAGNRTGASTTGLATLPAPCPRPDPDDFRAPSARARPWCCPGRPGLGRRCRRPAQEDPRGGRQPRLRRPLRPCQRGLAQGPPGAGRCRRDHRPGPAVGTGPAAAAPAAGRGHGLAEQRGPAPAGGFLGQRPGRGGGGGRWLPADRQPALAHRCDQQVQGRAGHDRRPAPGRHPGGLQLRPGRGPAGAGPPHRLFHAGRHGPARPGLLHPRRCRHPGGDGSLPRLRAPDPGPDRHPGTAPGRRCVGGDRHRDRAGAQVAITQ